MAYNLIITEHANELLDNLVYHLLYKLKNKQAAKHLLDGIEGIYNRLGINPLQFSSARKLSNKTITTNSLQFTAACAFTLL